ncbi:MAG: acyl-CoA dehydrogenase family protein [Solirubrobacterales bacterium]|nr:acyl-CoA dehydrogenase family protein [Solirubrobacterales bacterium]
MNALGPKDHSMTLAQTDETLDLIADVASSFARREPSRVRALRDDGGHVDRQMWTRLADNGWLGILIPGDLGGAGLGVEALTVVARRLGAAGFPEPFVAAGVLAPLLLVGAVDGDAETRLTDVLDGTTVVGFGHAGDVAEVDGRLTGTSRFTGVEGADAYIVAAGSPGSRRLFWVTASAAGLTVETELAADGTRSAMLTLDGVDGLLLHTDAEPLIADALALARVALAAELVGNMDTMLELTLEHLGQRRQFGRPIGAFQALQHRAVDAWIQRELADAALEAAVRTLSEPSKDDRARDAAASSAKAAAAHAAGILVKAAVQLHGAIGYTDEYEVGLYVNRALTLAPYLGNADEHTRRLAELSVAEAAAQQRVADPSLAVPAAAELDALSDEEFRRVVRADIEANYPPALRYAPRRLFWDEQQEWIDHLIARGWVAPGWPVEHGGMGLGPLKQIIFWEEHERWGAALYREHGVVQVGPMLMKHGTTEQLDRWLPPILTGEHHWCQGYSESEAGSDLASLRTRAVREGDHYVVDGQKIWTTLAQAATHIYFLARTDPAAKKQQGISFLLAPIDTPGITVRPIRDIAGHDELCEVFFDGVRVPVENLVGAENHGWTIAKSLLGHERITIGSPSAAEYGLEVLRRVSRAAGVDGDSVFRARYAVLHRDVVLLRDAYHRYKEMLARGQEIGPDVSLLKIVATETFQRIAELTIDTAGDAGGFVGADVQVGDASVDVLTSFYRSLPMTIYGGSNEIQRGIIATAVLGLPRG